MKRSDALVMIKTYYNRPVFNVKIGMGSSEISDVGFETALDMFDHLVDRFDTDKMEYVYIYASDYMRQPDQQLLDEALKVFNLGAGRHALNVYDSNKT